MSLKYEPPSEALHIARATRGGGRVKIQAEGLMLAKKSGPSCMIGSSVRLWWEFKEAKGPTGPSTEIGNLLPNNQRQRRTCHILYPVPAAHTSIFRMDLNSTSYRPSTRRTRLR